MTTMTPYCCYLSPILTIIYLFRNMANNVAVVEASESSTEMVSWAMTIYGLYLSLNWAMLIPAMQYSCRER